MAFESQLRTAESLTTFERGEELLDVYIENVKHDLEVEIKRIITEKPLLGEGKAAKVFDLELSRLHCSVCVKIWNPELEKKKSENPIEYRKIQAISPEEEFRLQDQLYLSGFKQSPRAIAYGKFGEYYIFAMEKIDGYTLRQIMDFGSKIKNKSWRDLELTLINLNRNHGVAHRDLHPGNIMLKTDRILENNILIDGELVIIDFGLSQKTAGMPIRDDYRLTLGKNTIVYKDDKESIDELKPARDGSGRSPFIK